MASNDMPELGSKISLISKADIRYEGKLFTVDPQDCTIALASVRSFGTEDRSTDHPVPAQSQVYDYILFRATDIKDISVVPSPPVLFDPAIVQLSVPPSINPTGGSRFQGGFQHPILGQLGGQANEAASSRPVGSAAQPSYNPMQSSGILNPLQQRSRQTRSVAELLGGSNTGSGGGGGGGGGGSRSSTPGVGRRLQNEQGGQQPNQRQSPPRYSAPEHPSNQRNRQNSQSNSSNHEERSYSSRQYSQTKPREQQPQRFGNRNLDNGFNNRDNRNDGGYNRDNGYRTNDMYGYRNNQQQNMQQRRGFQMPMGQQNQRINSRGTSGDRLQDQQRNSGLGNQQRRNQGWSNNGRQGGQRQGGNQRQGQSNAHRRQFNNFGQPKQQPNKQPLKFDSDYDFDKANTEFEELRLTLAQVKIGDNPPAAAANPVAANGDDKKDDSGNETAVGECDQEDEGVQQVSSAYDKTKSFFDNISCEAIERSKGRSQRMDWRKELKLNSETFGVTMSRRIYINRGGRGYYNRGSAWNYKPRQQQNNMIAAKV